MTALVTGIFTIMLGASRLNSSACSTMARESRSRRGSVWMESLPFLPLCKSKQDFSRAALLTEISRTSCQPIWSSVAVGCSFNQGANSIDPQAHFFLEGRKHDDRIAGRAHRSVFDRIGQFVDRGRVIPQATGSRLCH